MIVPMFAANSGQVAPPATAEFLRGQLIQKTEINSISTGAQIGNCAMHHTEFCSSLDGILQLTGWNSESSDPINLCLLN